MGVGLNLLAVPPASHAFEFQFSIPLFSAEESVQRDKPD
jgi:hypothetical protein